MSGITLKGQYYEVTPQMITVFGYLGAYHGSNWILNMPVDTQGNWVNFESVPTPMSSTVYRVLAGDIAAGRAHLIANIVVVPQVAVALFLEGVLTYDHFTTAMESPSGVQLTGVRIDGEFWNVLIVGQAIYPAFTVDANGQIV